MKLAKNIIINIFLFFTSFVLVYFLLNFLLNKQIENNVIVSSKIDSNLFLRFGHYIRDIFNGSFGQIYNENLLSVHKSIPSLFFNYFGLTFGISTITYLFSLVFGSVLSVIYTESNRKLFQRIIFLLVIFISSVPLIILLIVLLIFSSSIGYPSQYLNIANNQALSLIVPVFVFFFATFGFVFFKTTKITQEVKANDWFLLSKTLGMSKKELFLKNVFKNLFLENIKWLVPFFVLLMTISIVVERIFSIPGQSEYISFAYNNAENDMLMFYVTFSLLIIFGLNIIFSIICNWIEPNKEQNKNTHLIFRKKVMWHE
ncbi:ABC transporter permease subunit [[Mycoplasma] gypis]|uniref:ABC transporter permease subunit n=1 Tax=[Mycoplasma] gypis TaxID=92404 RepID=A0ABZ2RN24_9BACT|nr:ABC transporter permease subunit [[Mycoplasma] gypis]MBN0919570.1 ABC transporter permease subunit [[Mycoplasma] gypis]